MIEEKSFYNEAYKIIHETFDGRELEAMLNRLKVFGSNEIKDVKDVIYEENSIEKLYMDFKRNIIERGWLGTLDFGTYSIPETKKALERLSKDRIIANYKNIRRIEFVTPHERFMRRINRKYDMSHFQGYQKYKGTGYFSYYFDSIYHTLAISGSLEINYLILKVKFLTSFEMELFLMEYKNVFEINESNGIRTISLKILMDPFEYL